jgi:hypothetical protein
MKIGDTVTIRVQTFDPPYTRDRSELTLTSIFYDFGELWYEFVNASGVVWTFTKDEFDIIEQEEQTS